MKTTHTAAPWTATTYCDGSIGIHAGDSAYSLAVVKTAEDAALIASAPDLLAALETLTEWMRCHTGPADGTLEMLKTAVAAIAKAKGEL